MLSEIQLEFDKVKEKDLSVKKFVNSSITDLRKELLSFKKDLEEQKNFMTDCSPNEIVANSVNKENEKIDELNVIKNLNTQYNNLYAGLTKFGKVMAKNFENENIENFNLYNYDKNLFYQIIVKDLYRRGDFKTADSLIAESKLEFDQNFRVLYTDLNEVTYELKDKNIDKLIEWCELHRNLLDNIKSHLHFEALKLKFVILTKTRPASECIEFSKKYFQEFMAKQNYLDQIAKLMILIVAGVDNNNSFYPDLDEDLLWKKITPNFINDCCRILNLPSESGFYLATLAGMIAMPQIMKAEKIIKNKRDILNEKELPYEINLPNQLKFHPIFICPVTKEISTLENPPMLLNCGHAVSQNALEKMQKGTTGPSANQIKCPTCPNVQNLKDAQKLYIF